MSRPTARDISELRSKVIEIANEGYFKYCASSLDENRTGSIGAHLV